jgi:SAM-dependent methyltransferase
MSSPDRPNPWLSIPASDYEGHMRSPEVGQLAFLSDVFGEILEEFRPVTLAVLGCATGNGFERIDPARVRRVVGVDVNPEYLEIARRRFAPRIPGLELIRADLSAADLEPGSCDLIHAALVLEYAAPEIVVPKAAAWLAPGGVFSVVLQLPADSGMVTETAFASLRSLEQTMRLVDPSELAELTRANGLVEIRARKVTLPSGKPFFVAVHRRAMKER